MPQSWVYPTGPWERVHIDFAQFKSDYYLVVADAYSKWVEVAYMGQNTTTTCTIRELRKVFSVLGLPSILVSDNGPQFVSEEFSQFMMKNGIWHKRVPPYHSTSNSMAERMVQELKRSLKNNSAKAHPKERSHHLSNFLLSYRTTPHSTTGVTPAELQLIKQKLRTRLHLIKSGLIERLWNKQKWTPYPSTRNR